MLKKLAIAEAAAFGRMEDRMQNKVRILQKLFLSTLYLSTFTFGGGYVIVTLMKKKFVDDYHWIDEEEMLDLIAIAQSAPGAIAVNGAIVVGYKLAGLAGVFVSILGTIIPPFAILSVVSLFYTAFQKNEVVRLLLSGMQSGVAAVIASVVYEMGHGVVMGRNRFSIMIMAASFIASCFLGVNVIYIVMACIMIGVLRTWFSIKQDNHQIG